MVVWGLYTVCISIIQEYEGLCTYISIWPYGSITRAYSHICLDFGTHADISNVGIPFFMHSSCTAGVMLDK